MSAEHDAYAALRHRDYRLLLGGGVLTSIASEAQAVVVGWELYDRTGSALYLGLAGLAQFLPVLLLALPAGHAADRYSRKLLFQSAQATMAAASVGLALLSFRQGPVAWFFVLLVLSGCGRALSAPARSALLPQVVPTETLSNAVTWNSSGWQLASAVGPALGGLVLALAGRYDVAYLLSAGLAVGCVLLLSPVRPRDIPRPPMPRSL